MARPDTFTDKEKSWLKENYSNASWEEILLALPSKTKTQIISKAHVMGVQRQCANCAKFTKEEDDIIRRYYHEYRPQGIIEKFLPNRTYSSIITRAYILGVHTRGDWTEQEDAIIINNYYEMPMSKLANLLPSRDKSAIHCRIKQLGLSGAAMYKYSKEDITFVRNNYETMSDEELGEILHRTPTSIKEMRRKNKFYRKDPNRVTRYRYLGNFIHRNDTEWKKASAKQCNYKCFITEKPFDAIHHLYSRNKIIEDVCEKYNVSKDWNINLASQTEKENFIKLYSDEAFKHPLGICLTEEIHKKFHHLYGYGDNTVIQFKEFVQNFYPEKVSALSELIS